MGVEFLICGDCGEPFTDCGTWYICQKCEGFLCRDCGEEAIVSFGHAESEECGSGPVKCQACSGDTVNDRDVIDYLLETYDIGKTKKEIIEVIRESRKI